MTYRQLRALCYQNGNLPQHHPADKRDAGTQIATLVFLFFFCICAKSVIEEVQRPLFAVYVGDFTDVLDLHSIEFRLPSPTILSGFHASINQAMSRVA